MKYIIYAFIAILGGFIGGTISYLVWLNKPKMSDLDEKDIDERMDKLSDY